MTRGWCKKAVLLFMIVCLAMMTGCWDRRELEERTFVLAVGIDRLEGKKEMYKITAQIPIPIKIAGSGGQGGGSSGDAVRVMTTTGRTVLDAMNNLQKRLNQRVFLGHTRILAISEEVARRGTKPLFDAYRRDPTMRRLLWPVVVKGEAQTLLMTNPKLAQIPVVYIMDLIESGAKSGSIPDQTLGDFYIQTSSKGIQPFMNYVEASRVDVSWKGIAVFREDRMVGALDDKLSWVLMQLRDNQRGGDIVVPLPGKKGEYLTFRPHFAETQIEVKHNGGHMAHYTCVLQGDLIEITTEPDFMEKQNVEAYQKIIRQEMEKRAQKLIGKLQKEYRSDILKLGLWEKANHWDYWRKHDWQQVFSDFPIRVTYDIRIRRFGMEVP
ncbi:MAG: Ger(x)C family spore germination protein [Brevibacillus sp.]|nr:Ger(x)C family spore germination protein [Brevibacillus sp.]